MYSYFNKNWYPSSIKSMAFQESKNIFYRYFQRIKRVSNLQFLFWTFISDLWVIIYLWSGLLESLWPGPWLAVGAQCLWPGPAEWLYPGSQSPLQLFSVCELWAVSQETGRHQAETSSETPWPPLVTRTRAPGVRTSDTSASANPRCATFVLMSCTASSTAWSLQQRPVWVVTDILCSWPGPSGVTRDSEVSCDMLLSHHRCTLWP